MKKFECTVTKEITMEVEIDETIWTPEAIKEWSNLFYNAYDLSDMARHIARMKSEYDDGDFIEGFGVPMVDGKKPYPYLEDNDMAKDINICHQSVDIDIDVKEII